MATGISAPVTMLAPRASTPKRTYPPAARAPNAGRLTPSSIILDPKNPSLYTNRANARLKLRFHDLAISDCNDCLALSPRNMKAHFMLCQAQTALGDPDAALRAGLEAHVLCLATGDDKSLPAITAAVLQCKKLRWEDREKRRVREAQDLEREVGELLQRERDEMLAGVVDDVERATIEDEYEEKLTQMRQVFERARSQSEKRREVPDWAIDDISFGIMVDPVIVRSLRCFSLGSCCTDWNSQTKTGKSYERASIMEHLRRHPTDPLTREPLVAADLRPNLGLKQACDEFLEHNGWAVDW